MESWRNQPFVFWTFLLPGVVWLLVFFLVPLGFIWTIAFGERSGPAEIVVTWTWANYLQALDPIPPGIPHRSGDQTGRHHPDHQEPGVDGRDRAVGQRREHPLPFTR